MFYDRFAYLCKQKGISVSRGAVEAGISKSLVTKWKTNNVEVPSPDVLSKLSRYFNLTISELLGEEVEKAPAETSERKYDDDGILFALSRGGEAEITDEMYEEVKNFAAFIAQREAAKKKNQEE